MELRPLDDSHADLLTSLQQQEDVWESIGTLPVSTRDRGDHVFAIVEGPVALGFAGLVKSQAAGGDDFELLCALRSEAQTRGMAKQACQLVLGWAFQTAKLERVIACIDEGNQPARAIAGKLGMKELGQQKPNRIVYVKYREAPAESRAPAPPRVRQS
ncbi:MAG TPA: GNAT family N-acetyltransferase [Gemmatimonadales bacterium]|nr:MAG: hypothetical protein DMD54_17235 [Gemmatimonadota bacterium]HUC40298.1 GNAT family N-acetyltransferase [Gemmatimonadales bacterium]